MIWRGSFNTRSVTNAFVLLSRPVEFPCLSFIIWADNVFKSVLSAIYTGKLQRMEKWNTRTFHSQLWIRHMSRRSFRKIIYCWDKMRSILWLFNYALTSNVTAEWSGPLLRTRGVPDSNLGAKTCCAKCGFSCFHSVILDKYRDSTISVLKADSSLSQLYLSAE
jgi:hypothetical protein